MAFDVGMLFYFIIGIIVLAFFWVLMKKIFSGNSPKDLPGRLINQIKKAPHKIPEKVFVTMREKKVSLVPEILKVWPELPVEKKEQLWEFWKSAGYIEVFMKGLGAKNEEGRIEAARVLIGIKHRELIFPLIDALASPHLYVPARVAEVLLSFGQDAVAIMISRLPDLSVEAKCPVISILAELGDPAAIPGLMAELSHPSSQVRMKAAEALGEIQDGKAAGGLIFLMEDTDWGVRSMAAKALGKIKSQKAVPVLERALQDEAWWVRKNAEEALKRITLGGRKKTGEIS